MNDWSSFFWILWWPTFLLPLIAMVRSRRVLKYRMQLIDSTGALAKQEILEHGDLRWKRRFDPLHTVSYNRMVIHFWRPLPSFFTPEQLALMGQPAPSEGLR